MRLKGSIIRIWILDVSRQLKSAHLDGFDISPDQFPQEYCLPASVALQTLDIFSDVPEEFVGKYDIVNVRLFLIVVRNDDPRPILKNLISMLSRSSTRTPCSNLKKSDHLNNWLILVTGTAHLPLTFAPNP